MMLRSAIDKLEFQKVLSYISKYCITEKGREIVNNLSPISDHNTILNEGSFVNQAKEILIRNSNLPIEYLSDLSETISKSRIEGSFLEGKKLLEILRLLIISRNLYSFLKSNSEVAPTLNQTSNSLFIDKLLEHHIQKIITESGEIKENASPKLLEIKKEINSKKDDLIKSVNKIVKSLSEKDIAREDYLTLRDGRIVIPIKSEHKRHIRGFIHSESSSGQTVYIEPEETLELNNEIISLSFAEKREIERLLKELTKKIGIVCEELKNNLNIIAYFDSVFAKAKYSMEIIGSFPEINNNKPFQINDARHPILLKKNGRENTVPLNIEIDKNKVVVITGPNAGGKTVVIKTIGLLALMVKAGIHIPANPDSNFNFFENILVDIGDEQSLEDDLSTFSSHLSNIKNIIESAGLNSLVLLDEVGTGTDPTEGSALATAILLLLKNKGATVFATTHHGSLKLVANEQEGFENAAMEFDTKNLKPTYKFKQGIPGSSYAFEIAKRIGFNDDFINLAENYLDGDKHKIEKFLVEIESKSREAVEKLRKVELENLRLTSLSNLYKQNVEKLDKEKKDILKHAKAEADDYLKDINKKFEKVIKDLKESNADTKTIKSSKEIINDLKIKNKELFKEEVDLQSDFSDFVIGDYAAVKNTETVGEVKEINKEKNKAALRVGALTFQVKLSELVHVKKEKQKVNVDNIYNETSPPPELRLDIRGERPDEAEFEVIKFIDSAYTSGLNRVEILHGKGTGALKKTVKDILKNHDKVKTFYFAPIEFGGEGITIAELK